MTNIACNETVQIWIDNFKLEEKGHQGLLEEIKDVEGTISNERLWQKGSANEEEASLHEQNIADLTKYLEWLKEQSNVI